jgi:hypothetical protein
MAATGPDGAAADEEARNPITGIAGCCALAASGQATAVPPSSVMNSRRFIDRIAFGPPPARAGLQDIELARMSQGYNVNRLPNLTHHLECTLWDGQT